jgi:hypothetical protein
MMRQFCPDVLNQKPQRTQRSFASDFESIVLDNRDLHKGGLIDPAQQ